MPAKLFSHLLKAYSEWRKDRNRTSWLYCPVCKHDLNGDDKSFLREKDNHWFYKCANCGCKSKWGLLYLMPVCVAWQRVNGAMRSKDFKLEEQPVKEDVS